MMRWHSNGHSCIRPSMVFPSLSVGAPARNFREGAPLFRFRTGPSPVTPKVSHRADGRNGFVMSYGTAPISSLQRAPISRRWRDLVPGHLLFALLFLTGAGGGGAVAEDVPLPRLRPSVWLEPHTFREAAGPDFNSTEVTNTPTDCNQRLQAIAVIELLPRLIGPDACGGGDIVRLHAVMPAGNGSR